MAAAPLTTYGDAVRAAGHILAQTRARMATLTAEQIADEAYVPGGPSREELISRVHTIRSQNNAKAA